MVEVMKWSSGGIEVDGSDLVRLLRTTFHSENSQTIHRKFSGNYQK